MQSYSESDVICEHCGEVHDMDDMTWCIHGDQVLCMECVAETEEEKEQEEAKLHSNVRSLAEARARLGARTHQAYGTPREADDTPGVQLIRRNMLRSKLRERRLNVQRKEHNNGTTSQRH